MVSSICYNVQRISADEQFSEGITIYEMGVNLVCPESIIKKNISFGS